MAAPPPPPFVNFVFYLFITIVVVVAVAVDNEYVFLLHYDMNPCCIVLSTSADGFLLLFFLSVSPSVLLLFLAPWLLLFIHLLNQYTFRTDKSIIGFDTV